MPETTIQSLKQELEHLCDENRYSGRLEVYELLESILSQEEFLDVIWNIYWLCQLKEDSRVKLNQKVRKYHKEKTRILKIIEDNTVLRDMILNLIHRAGYKIEGDLRGLLESLFKEAYPFAVLYELIGVPKDGRRRPSNPVEDKLIYQVHHILERHFPKPDPFKSYDDLDPKEIIYKIYTSFLGDFKTDKGIRDTIKRGAELNPTL